MVKGNNVRIVPVGSVDDDLSYMRFGQRDVSKVGRSPLPAMTGK
jgi:hypothetical protein